MKPFHQENNCNTFVSEEEKAAPPKKRERERESMNRAEVEMMLLSQYCLGPQTQMPQGETKRRRRRKYAKEEGEATAAGPKKRKLSAEQVSLLEMNFGNETKLEAARKDRLATELGLDPRQVAVWFQNRRVRWKSKQLEEQYLGLKTVHEAIVAEKCKLQDEVLKLQEQLSAAERKIRKLSERCDGVSEGERTCSPSSSLSMDTHQPFLGDFGDDFLYIPESTYCYINGLDQWMDLYGP